VLGSALRQVVDRLPESGGRWWWATALPTRPPLGLAGRVGPPPGKGQGVLLVEDCGDYQVEPLD
jgi:hypothetical protein